MAKKHPKRTQRYRYTMTWEVTGMTSTITRTIWVKNGTKESENREAQERVRYIRSCFGKSAKITRLVRLKNGQPDLFERE